MIIGQVAARQYGVDQLKADSGAFGYGYGHGAVELDHRRRGSLRQQIVQRDDLAAVLRVVGLAFRLRA